MSSKETLFSRFADKTAFSVINPLGQGGSDGGDDHFRLEHDLRPCESQDAPACSDKPVLPHQVFTDFAPFGVVIKPIGLDEQAILPVAHIREIHALCMTHRNLQLRRRQPGEEDEQSEKRLQHGFRTRR